MENTGPLMTTIVKYRTGKWRHNKFVYGTMRQLYMGERKRKWKQSVWWLSHTKILWS